MDRFPQEGFEVRVARSIRNPDTQRQLLELHRRNTQILEQSEKLREEAKPKIFSAA